MGIISKIPNNWSVITSDNNKIGNVEDFDVDHIFVNEVSTNFKPTGYKIPKSDIDIIEDNEIKLKITRKDIEKYILTGDDSGRTRDYYRANIKRNTKDSFDIGRTREYA